MEKLTSFKKIENTLKNYPLAINNNNNNEAREEGGERVKVRLDLVLRTIHEIQIGVGGPHL